MAAVHREARGLVDDHHGFVVEQQGQGGALGHRRCVGRAVGDTA
jgi:hypothetical protein